MSHSPAIWGLLFTAAIYLLGNGVWTNRLVRRRRWLGWPLWLASCALVLAAGAAIEVHFGAGVSVGERLASVDPENHWIALSLYALMSVPGAACVILRQSRRWTFLSSLAIALLIFVPAGLHQGEQGSPALGAGIAALLCGLLWLWQATFDGEPEPAR